MKNHIFDLDHTVIDSSHRQRLLPNGDLDLAHWIANRKNPDLVMADRLLPFVEYWRAVQSWDQPLAICTSRVITSLEHRFLRRHGLQWNYFIHRHEKDTRPDAEYKVAKIRALLDVAGWEAEATTLYDDHPGVRKAVKEQLGVNVYDPVPFNRDAMNHPYHG